MDATGTTGAGSGGDRTTSSAASHGSSTSSGVVSSSASGSSSSGTEPGCVDAGDAGDALDAAADVLGMACEDPCDVAAIMAHPTIENDVYSCTLLPPAPESPAQCIAKNEGLSMACAVCWAQLGTCGEAMCAGNCFTGAVYASGCNDCLAMSCDCAFTACSGIVRPAAVDAGVDAPCD
jgi:hypothetical protein